MARFTNRLDHVSVAAPCPADWDQMAGNDRVRFCGQCNLNVYNLSELSKREAEAFISNSEGRLCVRYYRRADGSILTRNCPVGLRAIRRRVSRVTKAICSSILGFLAGIGVYSLTNDTPPTTIMGTIALRPAPGELPVMGKPVVIRRSPPFELGKLAIQGEMIMNPEFVRQPKSRRK